MSAVNHVSHSNFPLLSPFPLRVSCQVSSFWRAFTSLNDIWQQWKATENCLLIRAKLVDGTDEVVSQKCRHIQVMTFRPPYTKASWNTTSLYPATSTYGPNPISWLFCLCGDEDNLFVREHLQTTCESVLTNTPRDTEISILLKSNCAVLSRRKMELPLSEP